MASAKTGKRPYGRGDAVSYTAFHARVRALHGTPQRCGRCGTTDPGKTYDWANLTGNYADPSDYQRMCRSCHRRYDMDRREPQGEAPRIGLARLVEKAAQQYGLRTHLCPGCGCRINRAAESCPECYRQVVERWNYEGCGAQVIAAQGLPEYSGDPDAEGHGARPMDVIRGRLIETYYRPRPPRRMQCAECGVEFLQDSRGRPFKRCADCRTRTPAEEVPAALPVDPERGKELLKLRKAVKVSCHELAQALGASRYTVQRAEEGEGLSAAFEARYRAALLAITRERLASLVGEEPRGALVGGGERGQQ